MSWVDCRAGIVQVLRDVEGLKSIDDAEPPAVNMWPYAFVLYHGGAHRLNGGLSTDIYKPTVRVLFPWSNPRTAEGSLAPLVDRITDAFDRQRDLYGRIKNGSCLVESGDDALRVSVTKVSGVEYLTLEIHLRIVDNQPRPVR